MLCSNCFYNYGLKKIIKQISHRNGIICDNCQTKNGYKVTVNNIEEIMNIFFRHGSLTPKYLTPLFLVTDYNDLFDYKLDYKLTDQVKHDLELIKNKLGKNVKTPHINMVHAWGDTLLRWSLEDNMNKKTKNVLNNKLRSILDILIECCSKYLIHKNELLFRVRKNPLLPHDTKEYDSPDLKFIRKSYGRFDNGLYSLFYCSNKVDTCIFESKFEPTDYIVLATYRSNENLTIVDLENLDSKYLESLSSDLSEVFNEYDISCFLNAMIRNNFNYTFSQLISNRVFERGFAGIKYKSFYDRFRKKNNSNIALFGKPLNSKILTLESLNRVVINQIDIKWSYGPVLG